MTLSEWFNKNGKRPLLFYAAFCLIGQLTFSFFLIAENRHDLAEKIESQANTVIAIGLKLNNREVIESALATIVEEMSAEEAVICDGEKVIVGFPFSSSLDHLCGSLASDKIFVHKLLGYQYELIVKPPSLIFPVNFLGLNVSFLLFLMLSFFLFYRFQERFHREIFQPIKTSLLSNDRIGVSELENIRVEFKEKQRLEKEVVRHEVIRRIGRQVSHDLKSPIGALKAASENIEKKPEISKGIILRASERISQIVDDLNKPTFAVSNEANSTLLVDMLQGIVSEKNVEFDHLGLVIELIDANDEIEVLGLQVSLERAISNIINNGIEAVREGRPKISIRVTQNSDVVKILISDNGVGIPPEIKDHVFEYGFSNGKSGNTGTGLAQANSAIEENGGTLRLESTSETGTTFEIGLPTLQKTR